jgi:secreted trypsin-like serine protease
MIFFCSVTPSCQCGGPFSVRFPYTPLARSDRIINGFEVPPHSLPFQVVVVVNVTTGGQKVCGGTLISPSYVLTAANCMVSPQVFVLVGDHNITAEDGELRADVSDVLIHPLWNPPTTLYDYALLKLTSPVAITANVGLACLSVNANQNLEGVRLTASGWGLTSPTDTLISSVLRASFMTGLSLASCGAAFGAPAGFLPNYLLCAVSEGNSTTCNGDDGGKLLG